MLTEIKKMSSNQIIEQLEQFQRDLSTITTLSGSYIPNALYNNLSPTSKELFDQCQKEFNKENLDLLQIAKNYHSTILAKIQKDAGRIFNLKRIESEISPIAKEETELILYLAETQKSLNISNFYASKETAWGKEIKKITEKLHFLSESKQKKEEEKKAINNRFELNKDFSVTTLSAILEWANNKELVMEGDYRLTRIYLNYVINNATDKIEDRIENLREEINVRNQNSSETNTNITNIVAEPADNRDISR